ncbi:Protein SUR7 [Paramyrothecium foliicola]|nr:Protein SUR7 [Paramyrothecium foliicola]
MSLVVVARGSTTVITQSTTSESHILILILIPLRFLGFVLPPSPSLSVCKPPDLSIRNTLTRSSVIAMPKNAGLSVAGLVLLATSLLFLFFIILSGLTNVTPLNKTYFLRADTSGITGAREVTQWTYFYFCGEGNQDCGSARAAPPFGQAWDGNADNVPSDLIGGHGGDTTSRRFFYLWRFGWVFFIIALFFEVLAFFSGFLACCGRLGAAISSLVSAFALFCLTIAVSLMTATFVIARNKFQDAGRDASLGRYAFGWAWGAFAALLLANILFCVGIRGEKGYSGRSWRRRRSVRSRSYDGRRVKEEYA